MLALSKRLNAFISAAKYEICCIKTISLSMKSAGEFDSYRILSVLLCKHFCIRMSQQNLTLHISQQQKVV